MREAGRTVWILLTACALAGSAQAQIGPDNVTDLQLAWDFPLGAAVTSSPTLAHGRLYVSSWNGKVYALDPASGNELWSFDSGSGFITGVQSTVLATPDGRVLFGDSAAKVYSLNGSDGSVVWSRAVGNPAVDHIWSGLATSNGRLFVSVASHNDLPCTNGRLVALDLATGADLWTLQTVPDRVCTNDTGVECSTDADCLALGTDPNASCTPALGAGVTATVSFDPAGSAVYMNTVGCFTFPSVGDSDTIFKIDAATGTVLWKNRVQPPEQFGACEDDPSIDCGTDADCPSGVCKPKAFYHDFGFLNGPIPVEVDDGQGGTRALIVSGSKDGTLYALDDADGSILWTNQVLPTPVTPDFAGFGLFNGPLAFADGRFFAALYQFSPATVPAPDHLQAFDAVTGATVWTDDIGPAWAGTTASNGVVFVGTNASSEFFAYDAASGTRLTSFSLPATTVSRANIDGDALYIGYGLFGAGGVRAYRLPLGKAGQKCVNTQNKFFQKVAAAWGKEICACLKDFSKGKNGVDDIPGCVQADRKGKRGKMEQKALEKDASDCASPPGVFYTGAANANLMAESEQAALLEVLFGSDVNGSALRESADKAGAKCQGKLAKTLKKCRDTHLKQFNACKKETLKGGAQTTGPLESCLEGLPSDGKVRKACNRLALHLASKCVDRGVDLTTAFPRCGGFVPSDVAGCLEAGVRCEECRALNAVDGLTTDCDVFDDGSSNASCPG
ncbi:MAG: PQQ-binding-like beta-propeller repeat protein, partial [Myxococcota bacterium]